MLTGMASPETPEVGDEVARVCAWADRLQSWGRVAAARQALRDALDRPGDTTELVIRLAMLERDSDDLALAVELLGKVLGERPGHLAASSCLARMLLAEGKAEEAATVIAPLSRQVGGESGELAGEIFRALGRHALAVEAFGEPASLSPHARRLRRRSWWRCGGPFRRVGRAALSSSPAPQLIAASEPTEELLEVVTWAEWLSLEGRRDESRQVILDALAVHSSFAVLRGWPCRAGWCQCRVLGPA
jgi:tetratricopeptide (TPR) repeat protein